jgi:hypothetical protein
MEGWEVALVLLLAQQVMVAAVEWTEWSDQVSVPVVEKTVQVSPVLVSNQPSHRPCLQQHRSRSTQ